MLKHTDEAWYTQFIILGVGEGMITTVCYNHASIHIGEEWIKSGSFVHDSFLFIFTVVILYKLKQMQTYNIHNNKNFLKDIYLSFRRVLFDYIYMLRLCNNWHPLQSHYILF